MDSNRPPAKWQAGQHVSNAAGKKLFIFSREWGPDNRFVKCVDWAYSVLDAVTMDHTDRTVIAEEQLIAFAAS